MTLPFIAAAPPPSPPAPVLLPVVWLEYEGRHIECQVLSAAIHHGRDDATTQPSASTAVLELVDALPPEAVIGALVRVRAQLGPRPTINLVRFTGEITDVRIGWDPLEGRLLARPQLICTGELGRLGRRMVGSTPWPAERDGHRVQRILAAAGVDSHSDVQDPGTVDVLARDVDRRAALELAHETANDGGGILWQNVRGWSLYADAAHRRGAPLGFTFDACDLGVGLLWTQSLEGVVNDVFVRYGDPVAELRSTDPVSVTEFGTFAASLSTRLVAEHDARRRADELVARQSRPAWIIGGLELDLYYLDSFTVNQLLDHLEVHTLIRVVGLPPESPATEAYLWVEGWRESIDPGSWILQLAVSDYCRTAGAEPWDAMAQSMTWDTADPAMTWDGAVCFPPSFESGASWDEAEPGTRWDDVGSSIGWDSWGSGP